MRISELYLTPQDLHGLYDGANLYNSKSLLGGDIRCFVPLHFRFLNCHSQLEIVDYR